ncbi:MAG: AMIN-like domain-containing (lipo)protein [Pseudonocardiaceae bacterium]
MGAIIGRILATLFLSTAVIAAGVVPAQSAPAHSAPAQSTQPPAPDIPVLTGIQTGVHPAFDRIVLGFSGPPPQVSSRFVDELIQDGSGEIEWLTGAAFAEVRATPAQAHDDAGHSSHPGPRKFRTRDLANVMAVAITGDYEAYLTIGVGVRRQTWVKVFTLTGPTCVVIDVGR